MTAHHEAIEQYISAFAFLNEDQVGAYWDWQRTVAKRVVATPYQELRDSRMLGLIKDMLLAPSHRPRAKGCYLAAALTSIFTETDYVEGYACHHIPLQHAWNAHGDDHFDMMYEVDTFKQVPTPRIQVIRLSPAELMGWIEPQEGIGELLTEYYLKHVAKESDGTRSC